MPPVWPGPALLIYNQSIRREALPGEPTNAKKCGYVEKKSVILPCIGALSVVQVLNDSKNLECSLVTVYC